MDIRFVKYDLIFLEYSWEWLNDPEIKKLTMTPDFTKRDQTNWFNTIELKKDYFIRGITCNNIPVGVVGIKHIDSRNRTGEYFGYIGEKEYWSKGIGKILMSYIQETAINMGLRLLYLYVTSENHRAIQLYLKSGFTKENSIACGTIKMFCNLRNSHQNLTGENND